MFDFIQANILEGFKSKLNLLSEENLFEALRATNEEGDTLLHVAVKEKKINFVKELLKYGSPLDIKNKAEKTPLEIAEGNIEILLNMHKKWLSLSNQVNVYQILKLINEIKSKLAAGNGKDKVLLLGHTGAGKSTFLNYANGTRYKSANDEFGFPIIAYQSGENEIAEVGHELSSKTLIPQVVDHKKYPWSYCDLAGLGENRTPTSRIIAACATQLLCDAQGKMKGILVVTDLESLSTGKGERFKQTLQTLNKIIGSTKNYDSIYFLITKAPKTVTREGIIKTYIDPILSSLNNRNKPLTEEEKCLNTFLLFISKNANRILIPDITDQGKSLTLIENALNTLQATQSFKFDFLNDGVDHQNFKKLLLDIKTDFEKGKQKLEIMLPAQILLEKGRKEEIERDIAHWKQQVSDYEFLNVRQLNLRTSDHLKSLQKKYPTRTTKEQIESFQLEKFQIEENHRVAKTAIQMKIEALNQKISDGYKKFPSFTRNITELQAQMKKLELELKVNQALLETVLELSKLFIKTKEEKPISKPQFKFYGKNQKEVFVWSTSLTKV